jgi:hypothetical protein
MKETTKATVFYLAQEIRPCKTRKAPSPHGDEEVGGKTDVSNVTEVSAEGILEGPRRNWILQGFHVSLSLLQESR